MQLPDEAISYDYQGALPASVTEWTPAAELRARNFLLPGRVRDLAPRLMQIRSQVATERDLPKAPPELQPLDAGFLDLPQKLLDDYRRKAEVSELGRILAHAARLRSEVDTVLVLGVGGSSLGAHALFKALCNSYHNLLPSKCRRDVPHILFEGDHFDNDAFQELIDMLQETCVDPERREERYGAIVISKSGNTLETALAYRLLRREAAGYYGVRSERLRKLVIPITGANSRLRDLCKAEGFDDQDIFTIPDNVGGRFSVFTPAGLVPAAVMGLDVRALLLGATAMMKRFLEEPFERNPVLQYAAVNHLMAEETGKPIRVLSVWSQKLAALGHWYDQLVCESLGKQGRGPTPLTAVEPRDLHSRGQQQQDGARDKFINNLVVRAPRSQPIAVGMSDQKEDDLNALNRKTLPDLTDAALRSSNQAYFEAARPTANLVLPVLSEHTMGQLMQMLMLATVVEGRLMGVNPYGQPGVEAYKNNMRASLTGT